MLRVKVLTILLLVGLSTQIPFKFTLFDNTVPDISQKCQNELTKEASKVQTCVNTLGLKYAEKIQKDFPNIDALKKDVCALIKDEQNQCINIVKDQCTDAEIALLDKLVEETNLEQLKKISGHLC